MMVEALQYGAATKQLYDLYAYVVMPNHVHVVLGAEDCDAAGPING
jgi:REP element-mobilizing transposase RayT